MAFGIAMASCGFAGRMQLLPSGSSMYTRSPTLRHDFSKYSLNSITLKAVRVKLVLISRTATLVDSTSRLSALTDWRRSVWCSIILLLTCTTSSGHSRGDRMTALMFPIWSPSWLIGSAGVILNQHDCVCAALRKILKFSGSVTAVSVRETARNLPDVMWRSWIASPNRTGCPTRFSNRWLFITSSFA